ncbi:MAG: sirohydrochlorin chelatase [Actinomycetota bacterium]|nr:MAG: sirohydrochlorin chelatase [Actinomycetota bacterium]
MGRPGHALTGRRPQPGGGRRRPQPEVNAADRSATPGPRPQPPAWVLLAHGSEDPRHAREIEWLAAGMAGRRPDRAVAVAYLDHQPPDLATAIGALPTRSVVVVPALLSEAFHALVDVPAAVDAAVAGGATVALAAAFGADPAVLAALDELAGERQDGDGLLAVAAGTSDAAARTELAGLVDAWGRRRQQATAVAFAAGAGPTVADGIAALRGRGAATVTAVPLVLAPGRLLDRALAQAAALGAPARPGGLARTGALADLAVRRAEQAEKPG